MTFALKSHPATPSDLVKGIEVSHEWQNRDTLWLRYFVDCPVDQLLLPDPADPARMDNLWKTTCFELFLREPGAAAYCEFNFSPSSQWAAYDFTDFREGAHDLEVPTDPVIAPLDAGDSYFALEVEIVLPEDRIFPELSAAISAIIVDKNDEKTCWGFAHPDGAPDFHHGDCFAARLTPPVIA